MLYHCHVSTNNFAYFPYTCYNTIYAPVQGRMILGLHTRLSHSRASWSRSSSSKGRIASWTIVLCAFTHRISDLVVSDQSTMRVSIGTRVRHSKAR